MAMEINATLVVQAFNFFVTYLLLRFLFFKPAFKALQQEQKEKEHLTSLIDQREQELKTIAQQKTEAWHEFQEQFLQAAPPIRKAHVVHTDVEPAEEPVLPGKDQMSKLAQDLQKAIVKKVQHVK